MVFLSLLFVPLILSLIALEFYFVRNKQHGKYEFKDTLANLGVGLGALCIKMASASLVILPYYYFYQFRVFNLPSSWWVFLILIFAEDYAYYWFHRLSHETRFFWCSHETHHSSESLNIGTSIRQSWTSTQWSFIFWMPLVIFGFPPEWVLIQQTINLLYQIFVHTESIGNLGVIEYVFNTPSHHRVHHANNIQYLDKNYAGIFIIWDRFHGTFAKERETPRYGTLAPLSSHNPLIICFHMWPKLFKDIWAANNLRERLQILYKPPGWKPDGSGQTTRDLQRTFTM